MRWIVALAACLIAGPALAGAPLGMLNPQVQPANGSAGLPIVDDNLGAGGYPVSGGICGEFGHRVPCNNHYSIVRASTKYVSASDGIFASVPTGVIALGSGNGVQPELSRTNDALWARDMTNVAWTATTMTAVLNAVGIDGTANSATILTATGASATILQTITLTSQADNYSVYLKRVTGSGTISLCLAATACGTATACTVTSTTTFTRCTVTATVLNPIVGIQIATSGDVVIADFNQMEPGGFPTSPILTTSAAQTRSSDLITVSGVAKATLQGSAFSVMIQMAGSSATLNNTGMLDGNVDDFLLILTPTTLRSTFGATSLNATLGSGSYTTTSVKSAIAAVSGARSLVANNGTVATDATSISVDTSIFLGSFGNGSGFSNAFLKRPTMYPVKVSDTILQALTQ